MITEMLQENVLCRPSPVIVKLPLPNNTDIQQVVITKYSDLNSR